MDPLTHACSGLTLAELVIDLKPQLGRDWKLYRHLCFIIAAVPDLDLIPRWISGRLGIHCSNRLLHSFTSAIVVTALFTFVAVEYFSFATDKLIWLCPSLLGCYLLHLFFDWLSTNPICLFHPFSSKYYCRRLIASFDPVLLALFGYIVVKRRPAIPIFIILVYLAILGYNKRKFYKFAKRDEEFYVVKKLGLQPYPRRFWTWFLVVKNDKFKKYYLRSLSVFGDSPWHSTPAGDSSAITEIISSDRSLKILIDSMAAPKLELRKIDNDKNVLIIEDIIEWNNLTFRKKCFVIHLNRDMKVRKIERKGIFKKGPLGKAEKLPIELKSPPIA